MSVLGHQRTRAALAAYALDAVDSIERELVEVHIAVCEVCAVELRRLRESIVDIDRAQERPPERVWDAIRSRVRAPSALPVSLSSSGVATRVRAATKTEVRTESEVLLLTAEATRQLLWIESELDAVAVVARLVEQLGGSVVPADAPAETIPDAIPVDISFGACQPLSPAAPALSVARLHLEEALPGVLEDARRAVAIVRNRKRAR